MTTPHDIRRLALLGLYQLDARPGLTSDELADAVADAAGLADDVDGSRFLSGHAEASSRDLRRACELALAAWSAHEAADKAVSELTPDWPTRRQAAIDRAIFRLAHHELVAARAPAAVVIDEAVELAKAFGGEKSPAFINGVLARLAKAVPASPLT